jgi:hypothetical protein
VGNEVSLARWIRIAAVVLAGFVLLPGLALWWFNRPPANERPELPGLLLSAARQAGDGGVVDLSQLTAFEWERGHIVGPYTDRTDIADCVGFDWTPDSELEGFFTGGFFGPSEGFALVVFVEGERNVTGWFVSSPYADSTAGFGTEEAECIGFHRSSARFRVRDASFEQFERWELSPTTSP